MSSEYKNEIESEYNQLMDELSVSLEKIKKNNQLKIIDHNETEKKLMRY